MEKKRKNITEFGDYLREIRLRAGYGLRRFAALIEMPASNLCDIEHGRRQMPREKLDIAAEALGIENNTIERNQFYDLASKNEELPADVQRIARRRFFPALLRTIDNSQLTDKDIEKLIAEIQRE